MGEKREHQDGSEDAGKSADCGKCGDVMPRNPLRYHVDVLLHLMPFIAGEGYLFVAGVSKHWRTSWGDRVKETHLSVAVQSESCLAWSRAS
ncbi:unnamed protein product, partial [Sphacelaria rigidula]